MTFQIRTFTEKDLPNLIKLLNEKNKKAYEFIPFNEERITSWMNEGRLKILIVEENGDFIGSAAYNDGHWGEEIEWLTVSEIPNRKTIENTLAKEVEKYVKNQKVFVSVDAESPKINEWIEKGYKAEGGLYHMIANLDTIKSIPQVPEDIVIRSLKPEEERQFIETVNAGFGWERLKQDTIQEWRVGFPGFNEEWIFVADHNNMLVSVVVAKPDVNHNKYFGDNRGYLGPATTLPEYRSRNLASALTQRAMNFLYEKGINSVALYTQEQNIPSVTLLQKLGFGIGHHWIFMRKNLSQQS